MLTHDYRGFAGSRDSHPRREQATMHDWAVLDMSAALAAAEGRRAGRSLPLLLVGHSSGGHSIAFARGVDRADAILCVASQLGEPRLFPGVHRVMAEMFLRTWMSAVVAALSHLPGWALAPGAQALPAGVARQWGHWGSLRGWAFAEPAIATHRGTASVVAPVHLCGIADDLTFASPRAIDALASQFPNAAVQRHQRGPADVGLERLGHFGLLRCEPGQRAWARLLAPIEVAALPLRMAGLQPLAQGQACYDSAHGPRTVHSASSAVRARSRANERDFARTVEDMNPGTPDLRIRLEPRSHFFSILAACVLLAANAADLWDSPLAVACASAGAVFLPEVLLGRRVPSHRGRDFGSWSIDSVFLVAVAVVYLLAAMRWVLPWILLRPAQRT